MFVAGTILASRRGGLAATVRRLGSPVRIPKAKNTLQLFGVLILSFSFLAIVLFGILDALGLIDLGNGLGCGLLLFIVVPVGGLLLLLGALSPAD